MRKIVMSYNNGVYKIDCREEDDNSLRNFLDLIQSGSIIIPDGLLEDVLTSVYDSLEIEHICFKDEIIDLDEKNS